MFNKFKPKSEFGKNVLLMMTGTTIAQAIPIAISPIISRIYTPQDFGVFAIYLGISSIIAVLATARYELAIVIPEKDEDAFSILLLAIILTIMLTIISFIAVLLFNDQITQFLNNKNISYWLYFIPLTVFFTGLYNSLNYWFTRKKQFKILARTRVNQSIVTAISNLSMGTMRSGPGGLILGGILGQAAATLVMGWGILKQNIFKIPDIKSLKEQAEIFIRFPKYSLAGAFLNISAYQIPVLLISSFFSSYFLGIFYFINRIMQAPFALLSNSFAQVFYEEASRKQTGTELKKLLFSVHKKLIMIYSIPSVILLLFGEPLFAFVFGEEWRIAGYYAKILLPFLIINFLFSTTSMVLFLYKKNYFEIILNTLLMLSLSSSIFIGMMTQSFQNAMISYSASGFAVFAYFGYWTYSQANNYKKV